MKSALLDYIVCPSCKSDLSLLAYEQIGSEIEEGLLSCKKCDDYYPVISGIPRLLPMDLWPKLITGLTSFLSKHDLALHNDQKPFGYDTDEEIAREFEYEWQQHAHILDEHEKEFHHVLGDVLPTAELDGKVVLDAGCGQGRFSYFAQKYGAETVISFDLGEQTLIAKKNLSQKETVHVVQASIYHPPFKSLFDIILSIGVIHHLPEPEKGFRTLYHLLNKNGKIFIWVYGYSSIIPLIKLFRAFTLNRSVRFNRMYSFFLALPLYLINRLYNILKGRPATAKLAESIPFHMYHDRGFSNIWTISFDKINSAIAVYYRRKDLEGWLNRLEDKQSGILSERYPGKSGSSWRMMVMR